MIVQSETVEELMERGRKEAEIRHKKFFFK